MKLSDDQYDRLTGAREALLNAGDLLHSVAVEMVGEVKKED